MLTAEKASAACDLLIRELGTFCIHRTQYTAFMLLCQVFILL